jgi:peptide/nickel transport system substrate-binding protein
MTAVLMLGAGCVQSSDPAANRPASTLTIGFGLTTGGAGQFGVQQAAANVALEGLIAFARDGRPQPWLAEGWSLSADGLTLSVRLRRGVTFHDGRVLTAPVVRDILIARLPAYVGPAYEDIEEIRAESEYELAFVLRKPSSFVLEGLDVPIQVEGPLPIGTGPFYEASGTGDTVEMLANEKYYHGKPHIDRIVIRPYASVRSAWADMLRGQVDMLYEVGADAVDLLDGSSESNVFSFVRHYASVIVLNVQRPSLRDSSVRRYLNAAIDRKALIAEALNGHGSPAEGPVWPLHWAYDSGLPRFRYEPKAVSRIQGLRLRILYAEPSHERLALTIQRQLRAAGIAVTLETAPLDQALARVQKGDFDGFLADAVAGPTLVRSFLFWHSSGPRNVGRFHSERVDQAFDAIRHAANEVAYASGVAAFQRAVVEDPPAIFLAWSQRARAVSTRFEVQVEAGRDILSTLRLWRPLAAPRSPSDN